MTMRAMTTVVSGHFFSGIDLAEEPEKFESHFELSSKGPHGWKYALVVSFYVTSGKREKKGFYILVAVKEKVKT